MTEPRRPSSRSPTPAEHARLPRTIEQTAARLGYALLGYMLAVTALITLLPFRFVWPVSGFRLVLEPLDLIANVLLFVPLGFLWVFAAPQSPRSRPAIVLCLGALVSLAIECVQLFEPMRNSTIFDVVANASGAALGAALCRRTARLARSRSVVLGTLGLELPLMGLVYLVVPLLWVHSLATQEDVLRGLLTLAIGVFGAVLIGGLQRHYFGPLGSSTASGSAVFATLWFAAGAFPLLPWQPMILLLGALMTGVICWWQGSRQRVPAGSGRRFEVPLLKVAAPVFAVYVIASALAPLLGSTQPWRAVAGFPATAADQSQILRLLERIAAVTLIGYMAAEFRGRRVQRFEQLLLLLVGWGVVLAVGSEALRGFERDDAASALRAVATGAAAVFGGWLYLLQRDHVMRLLVPKRL